MHAEARQPLPEIRRELCDVLLSARVLSVEVVEAIERWRVAGNRGLATWADVPSGDNYLLKMKADTLWLAESVLGEILVFSPKSDPFFVVPSAKECKRAEPSNLMTPTLKARRNPSSERRRGVLPLQSSILRRIRKAELVILREAVYAKMQQGPPPMEPPKAEAPTDEAHDADVTHPAAKAHAPAPAPQFLQQAAFDPRSAEFVEPRVRAVQRPLPPQPRGPDSSAFVLVPLEATPAEATEHFERWAAKVDPRLIGTLEPWKTIQASLKDKGADALEFHWLWRRGRHQGDGEEPDGLAIFRMKRTSTCVGWLLHVSVADLQDLPAAVESVSAHMFAFLPIGSIRVTCWYRKLEDKVELDKELVEMFKTCRFKWFQLTNSGGVRGQVMACKRRPDEDPPAPAEVPAIEASMGQVWFRDRAGRSPAKGDARGATFACSLLLAAACLKQLWALDLEAADEAGSSRRLAPAACEAAREGFVRALLSGELQKLLGSFEPRAPQADALDLDLTGPGAQGSATPLAVSLGRNLEASGGSVPGVLCETCKANVGSMLERGMSAAGYAQTCAGLGFDELSESAEVLRAEDAAFGRLFVTMDWHSAVAVDDQHFETATHAVGRCPRHPHPVFYLSTSEDDIFVVVIPLAGIPSPPREEGVFSFCTGILRGAEPMEPLPFTAVRMASLQVRHRVQTLRLPDAGAVGFQAGKAASVAEFGSISIYGGREMPGRLREPAAPGGLYKVEKPFIVGLWHTEADELNVPLTATLVA